MKPGPKKQFHAILNLRLSLEVMERLRKYAEAHGKNLSEYLREVLGEVKEEGHAS